MMCKSKLPLTDKKAIAVYPICNWGGYEIVEANDEQIELVINDGETRRYSGSHKLYTTKNGDVYFRRNGIRYYLSEFQKI